MLLCDYVVISVSYWMAGLSPHAEDYFFFLLNALCVDTALASFYRTSIFVSPSLILAEVRRRSFIQSFSECVPGNIRVDRASSFALRVADVRIVARCDPALSTPR